MIKWQCVSKTGSSKKFNFVWLHAPSPSTGAAVVSVLMWHLDVLLFLCQHGPQQGLQDWWAHSYVLLYEVDAPPCWTPIRWVVWPSTVKREGKDTWASQLGRKSASCCPLHQNWPAHIVFCSICISKGHFTVEFEGPWHLKSKIPHWWRMPRLSCRPKQLRKFEWMPNLHGVLHGMQWINVSWSTSFYVKPTSKRWVSTQNCETMKIQNFTIIGPCE